MNNFRLIRLFLLATITGVSGTFASAQDSAFHVIDFVDLPEHLNLNAPNQDPEQLWYIEFLESWHISPEKPSILKSVLDYAPKIQNVPLVSADSFQQRFARLILHLPRTRGKVHLDNISYEFMLLDPHLPSSGNLAFPEPDSMDFRTKELQGKLIDLVESRSRNSHRYVLSDQLLSVYFHEEWTIDPLSMQITKKVAGITPVIWQRRKTTEGVPINDADTGLPVYYKNPLHYIGLRNPE